jgi:hypothetical protein
MDMDAVIRLAELLKAQNAIDNVIAAQWREDIQNDDRAPCLCKTYRQLARQFRTEQMLLASFFTLPGRMVRLNEHRSSPAPFPRVRVPAMRAGAAFVAAWWWGVEVAMGRWGAAGCAIGRAQRTCGAEVGGGSFLGHDRGEIVDRDVDDLDPLDQSFALAAKTRPEGVVGEH